ncbi:hypothetical protein [Mesorhizobium amorphae]|uniref:hypothetical protein n=1 Tax=Mesorhizobium amorphae TaxID=71433 RepID=UPI0011822756|nr:hypothetical protein [Mesorhizobium amorphae]
MKDEAEADWSGRHVRLRFELVAVSLLLFLVTHYPLKPNKSASAIIFLPFEAFDVPPGLFTAALIALWVYLALHFFARTFDEYSVINRHTAVIKEILGEVELASRNAKNALEQMRMDGVIQRVDNALSMFETSEKLTASEMLSQHVADMSEQADRLAKTFEENPGLATASIPTRDQLQRLVADLQGAPPQRLLGLMRGAEGALEQLRQEMVLYRGFLANEIPNAVEPLVDKLNNSVKRLDKIDSIFKTGLRVRGLERHVFSVALPGIVSLALFVLSVVEWLD